MRGKYFAARTVGRNELGSVLRDWDAVVVAVSGSQLVVMNSRRACASGAWKGVISGLRVYSTEEVVGRAIASRRSEVVVSSKFFTNKDGTYISVVDLVASLEKSIKESNQIILMYSVFMV